MSEIKVYLSSTYRDLVGYREKVLESVRSKRNLQPLNMEAYLAGDSTPLEQCIRDVQASKIYIGVLAWSYGSLAPGSELSFTHHEYEAAKKAGAKCLMFLHEDVATWEGPKDKDLERIDAFRNQACTEKLVSHFSNPDDLRAKVSDALYPVLLEMEKHARDSVELTDILPYLMDRSDQFYELQGAITEHQASTNTQPMAILIEGSEKEDHARFIDRLRKEDLPKLLKLPNEEASIDLRRIEWPLSSAKSSLKSAAAFSVMKGKLAESLSSELLSLSAGSSSEEFAGIVSNERKPQLIYTIIDSDCWNSESPAIIDAWLSWWESWVPLEPGLKVFIALSFRFKETENRKLLDRFAIHRNNKKLEVHVDSIAKCGRADVRVVALTPLVKVQSKDVVTWLETHVKKFIDDQPKGQVTDHIVLVEKIKPQLESFFAEREGEAYVEELAGWLRNSINENLKQGA